MVVQAKPNTDGTLTFTRVLIVSGLVELFLVWGASIFPANYIMCKVAK